MKNSRIAVTGASGFLGSNLCVALRMAGYKNVKKVSRSNVNDENSVSCNIDGDLDINDCDWLRDIDVVVHCAARAHILDEKSEDPLSSFRSTNTFGTSKLADYAAQLGVRRFIYISSIKVHGETNVTNIGITEGDTLSPVDPYGQSKAEAEIELKKISERTGLDVVVIRPPLIYGPGVKANFYNLMKALNRGWPLPFGRVQNRRSFIGVRNLCSFILQCISEKRVANQVFLISDRDDMSTSTLLKRLKHVMGSKAYIFPFPSRVLSSAAALFNRRQSMQRLLNNLYVDTSKAQTLTNWEPPYSVDDELTETVAAFYREEDKDESS